MLAGSQQPNGAPDSTPESLMLPHLRRMVLGSAILWVSLQLTVRSGPYLPRLGPAPLRFRPLPAFEPTMFTLPPLNTVPIAPTTNVSTAQYSSPAPDPVDTSPAVPLVASSTPVQTNAPPAGQFPPVPENPLQISPQLFLEYFRQGGNETNGVQVVAPIGGFTPPIWNQPPAPQSSATYRSN